MTTIHHEHFAGLTDEQLVALCRGGDRDAFGVVVARYQSLICALTYAGCGDVHRSEDVAQETFLRAWKHLGDLREAGRLRAWLCGIARNLLAGERRKQGRHPTMAAGGGVADRSFGGVASGGLPFDESAVSSEPAPPEEAMRREERAMLWSTLERLPVEYREPLVLFYRHGESVAAVAAALELSEDAARQRLSRGRAMLAKRLEHIIHRGLRTTGPTQAFTLAVIAAIPAAVVAATSATLSATAATVAAADATTKTAVSVKTIAATGGVAGFSALLNGLVGIVGGYYGYKVGMAQTITDAERRYQRRSYWGLMAMVMGFNVFLAGAIFWAAWFQPTDPIWALPIAGIFLLYTTLIGLQGFRRQRRLRDLRAAAFAEDPHALAKAKETCAKWNIVNKSYKSRWTFLGLPLIHVNWEWRPDSRYNVAKGWIAMGGVAYGGLLAFGGVAVGPISFGGVTIGLLPMGGLALGVFAWGGLGVGVWAMGAVAIGWQAAGFCALAWHSAEGVLAMAGEYAMGNIAAANHARNAVAAEHFRNSGFTQFRDAMFRYGVWLMLLCGVWGIWHMVRYLTRLRSAEKNREG